MLTFLVCLCAVFEIIQLAILLTITKLWHGWYAAKAVNKTDDYIKKNVGQFGFMLLFTLAYAFSALLVFVWALVDWEIVPIFVPVIGMIMGRLRMPTIKKSLDTYRVFFFLDTLIMAILWIFARYTLN